MEADGRSQEAACNGYGSPRFKPIIYELNLADERAMEDLLLDREGPLSIGHGPVDYINAKARLVPAFTLAVIGDPLD